MGATNYPGVDYGLGRTNTDPVTGIRYGVIAMNDLSEWAWDEFEADYGEPHCPKCGNPVKEDTTIHPRDYRCKKCRASWYSEECLPDEPLSHTLESEEYKAFVDSSGDVMVLKSPYYTHAQFCSPCVPGAGHLGYPCPDGPRTYCLDKSWFEGGKAPYPVYRVDTGKKVKNA